MLNKEIFSQRLRTLRQTNGLSTRGLARALGISNGAITQYEKGLTLPALNTLVNIAELFAVSTDYLLGLSDLPSCPTIWEYSETAPDLSPVPGIPQVKNRPSSSRPMEALLSELDSQSLNDLETFIDYLRFRQGLKGSKDKAPPDINDER